MQPGQKVRFIKESRNAPFKKHSEAVILRVLAPDIYIIAYQGERYWVLGEDIEPWNQLSLGLEIS